MSPESRPELRALRPAVHGGDPPAGVIDFSTGVSPLPTPEKILAAARAADLSCYPPPTAAPLRARLGALHGVEAGEVAVGAGSAELIWALARAFAGPGRRALVFAPAFAEYAQALRASGATVEEVRAVEPGFAFPHEAVRAALASQPHLAFVCRPSNPCLSSLPLGQLSEITAAAPSTLFVIDEAYLPMFDEVAPAPRAPNVVVLRSLTKVFALPGLRLGYLVAPAAIAAAVRASLPPWNVSAPAQAAGLAAVDELGGVAAIRQRLAALRTALARHLEHPRARLDASGGPFLLYHVGDAPAVCGGLAAAGFFVRDCSSFGLGAHVRLGVRAEPDQALLGRAWHSVLA